MRIAHISDLHLSGKHFVREWGENLIKILNSSNLDLIVITGDLTDDGYMHEYEIAVKFIDRMEAEKLVVPGNHDARNKGYEIFEEVFGKRDKFYENDEIVFLGMDSSEPDLDEGHIGRENYSIIKNKLRGNKIKIFALHHHIIPIPGTGRERNILIDAGDVLKICIENKIDFVLSGHKHLPWIWKLDNTHFITTGTACSNRLKGKSYPSFNIIEISENIKIDEINVKNKKKRKIAEIENVK